MHRMRATILLFDEYAEPIALTFVFVLMLLICRWDPAVYQSYSSGGYLLIDSCEICFTGTM